MYYSKMQKVQKTVKRSLNRACRKIGAKPNQMGFDIVNSNIFIMPITHVSNRQRKIINGNISGILKAVNSSAVCAGHRSPIIIDGL
jgi:hypothetical protein